MKDNLTIEKAPGILNYIRSDLRAWVLRLPCEGLEKIIKCLQGCDLPEDLPVLYQECINQSYLSDSAARKEIKHLRKRWIDTELALINEIDYRIKQNNKLSDNKRALKNQLNNKRKILIQERENL